METKITDEKSDKKYYFLILMNINDLFKKKKKIQFIKVNTPIKLDSDLSWQNRENFYKVKFLDEIS